MTNNPFRYLLPVSPENFVGRMPLVKKIASDLTSHDGDSWAIIAGRRCGKSSLLNAIAHHLSQPETMNTGDWIALPALFDFKSKVDTFDSVEMILAWFLKHIQRQAGRYALHITDKGYSAASAISFEVFEQEIESLLDNLETSNVRLVLLLDEIDEALERSWTQALLNQLRALIYSSDIKLHIKLVIAGSHRCLDEVSKRGSPLWNVLKLYYLETFDEPGFQELIERANELPDEVATAIWQQSGGHPFLSQYLLHHLWEKGIPQATISMVDELTNKFLAEQM